MIQSLPMDALYTLFPVSGVKTWLFLPPLTALVVSTLASMGGVSGAFILLPFQMSVLGFTSPAVSSTNFVYNIVIVAIPSGVYRYFKEGRMAWPLTWVAIVGTLPGVFIEFFFTAYCLQTADSQLHRTGRWDSCSGSAGSRACTSAHGSRSTSLRSSSS